MPTRGTIYNELVTPTTAGRVSFGLSLAWVTICVVAFSVFHTKWSAWLFGVTAVAAILAIIAGPLLRKARPRRVWYFETAAGVSMLAAAVTQHMGGTIGPFKYLDLAHFTGYILVALWLTMLSRHVVALSGPTSILDSAAAGVGVGLALWALMLAPLAGDAQLPSAVVFTMYPMIDMVLLALAAHLAVRLEAKNATVTWLIIATTIQTCLDIAHTVSRLIYPSSDTRVILALFLYWQLALAMAACHPSVVNLSRQAPGRRPRAGARVVTAVMLLAVSPAILSAATPVTGPLDRSVRTTLVALLLTLLIARLALTVKALMEAEAQSRHRASHDELTGLINRSAVSEALNELLDRNAQRGASTAVLFIDCDDFKYVNDTWGHPAGDSLLKDIAARLPQVLRPDDVLGRHGGDEFVVLATVSTPGEACELAEVITRFFDTPLQIMPGRYHAIASTIGIAVAPPSPGEEPKEMFRKADVAMYEAKQHLRGRYLLFGDDLEQRTRTRAAVGDRLEEAIREGHIHIELQPVMGGPNYANTIGWEALARWHDPELGTVTPGVFIPLAEQLGLIYELGELVLRRACAEIVRLRRALPNQNPGIFVNVSPTQLLDPGFENLVRDVLRTHDLPPKTLRLEVTETMLIDEGPAVDDTLNNLREAGACIVLDDFGSGYASLATLLRLTVDGIKLDRSLVSSIGNETEAPGQIGAVIDLIHSLGINAVIAEGVETPTQAEALGRLGCPMVQGWLYGRPETPETLLRRFGVLDTVEATGDGGRGGGGARGGGGNGAGGGGERHGEVIGDGVDGGDVSTIGDDGIDIGDGADGGIETDDSVTATAGHHSG